jgi:hypothetical protein
MNIEIAFPAFQNAAIWEAFGKAFALAYTALGATYVAPQGTPPVATQIAMDAAAAKMNRALDKTADQRPQDKPATTMPANGEKVVPIGNGNKRK